MASIKKAIIKAKEYITSKQCSNGGFSFYCGFFIEEPNLYDTYFALKALKLINEEIPNVEKHIGFITKEKIVSIHALYYKIFSLKELNLKIDIDNYKEEFYNFSKNIKYEIPKKYIYNLKEQKRGYKEYSVFIQDIEEFIKEKLKILFFITSLAIFLKEDNKIDKNKILNMINLIEENNLSNSQEALFYKIKILLNLKENIDRKGFECVLENIDLDKMYYYVKIKNLFREKLVGCNDSVKKTKLLQDNFGAFSKKINALSNIECSYKALYIIKKCLGDKLCQS